MRLKILFMLLLCCTALVAQKEQRIALVIGNGKYIYNSPLSNPPTDADSMAQVLEELDFEVIKVKNADKAAMQKALDRFERRIQSAEGRGGKLVTLFYYSGHGMQVNGENYLIPIQCNLVSSADLNYQAISLQQTIDRLENHGNFLNILMMDACRDNPLTKSLAGKSSGDDLFEGYAQPTGRGKSGMFMSFATAPGRVADSGDRRLRTSSYVDAFLAHVRTPDLLIDELFNRVGRTVYNRTQQTQIPYKTGAFFDTFMFFKGPKPTPKTPDGMVFIQGGGFDRGDTFGEGSSDELPVHKVTVPSFYMGRYEITNRDFLAFLNAKGNQTTGGTAWVEIESSYSKIKGSGRNFYIESGYEDHPVVEVSWYGVVEYCNWRSQQDGLQSVYGISGTNVSCDWRANGYRLPTEAEWEYAAREGGRNVRFGNGKNIADANEMNFDARESYKKAYSRVGKYRANTTAVGSFSPNGLGLYDMSGNVWEWCWDWYDGDYYKNSSGLRHPKGAESGSLRVIRGGSWSSSPAVVRAAFRRGRSPGSRSNGIGFRLTRAE